MRLTFTFYSVPKADASHNLESLDGVICFLVSLSDMRKTISDSELTLQQLRPAGPSRPLMLTFPLACFTQIDHDF